MDEPGTGTESQLRGWTDPRTVRKSGYWLHSTPRFPALIKISCSPLYLFHFALYACKRWEKSL
jgi:hypothetical protein